MNPAPSGIFKDDFESKLHEIARIWKLQGYLPANFEFPTPKVVNELTSIDDSLECAPAKTHVMYDEIHILEIEDILQDVRSLFLTEEIDDILYDVYKFFKIENSGGEKDSIITTKDSTETAKDKSGEWKKMEELLKEIDSISISDNPDAIHLQLEQPDAGKGVAGVDSNFPIEVSRDVHANMYEPTTGDKIQLGDTKLYAEVENNFSVYGNACVFGCGKVLCNGTGQATGYSCSSWFNMLITNVTSGYYTGIYKADINIKGRIVIAIGKSKFFNESTYCREGNIHGKIAVNLWYERHHPLIWLAFELDGVIVIGRGGPRIDYSNPGLHPQLHSLYKCDGSSPAKTHEEQAQPPFNAANGDPV